MPEYEPATTEQYDTFLRLMREDAAGYLERSMELMDMTWGEFSHLFRTVGQVTGVYLRDELAGFYWIELREAVLHLHALILKSGFRGKGVGTQVLHDLEAQHCDGVVTIELGVHDSNRRAKRLYERLGFETVSVLEELGFQVMKKELAHEHGTSAG